MNPVRYYYALEVFLLTPKSPEEGVVTSHVTHFKFLVPLRYLWNGLS